MFTYTIKKNGTLAFEYLPPRVLHSGKAVSLLPTLGGKKGPFWGGPGGAPGGAF